MKHAKDKKMRGKGRRAGKWKRKIRNEKSDGEEEERGRRGRGARQRD